MLLQEKTSVENEIQTIAQKIAQEIDPEKIILFGSRAWGEPSPDSDVDLFVIKDTGRSTRDVAREIDGLLWGRTLPVDIIVSTPEKVDRRLQLGDFFIRDIISHGKVLYERRR